MAELPPMSMTVKNTFIEVHLDEPMNLAFQEAQRIKTAPAKVTIKASEDDNEFFEDCRSDAEEDDGIHDRISACSVLTNQGSESDFELCRVPNSSREPLKIMSKDWKPKEQGLEVVRPTNAGFNQDYLETLPQNGFASAFPPSFLPPFPYAFPQQGWALQDPMTPDLESLIQHAMANGKHITEEMYKRFNDVAFCNERNEWSLKTTVRLANIPNNVTRQMLVDLLEKKDFLLKLNFLYLPMDFERKSNLGYAFINFVSCQEALWFMLDFTGFGDWHLVSEIKSTKTCDVNWTPMQGYEAHVGRYRNSPVMHKDVLEENKPVIYEDGKKVDFPKPTKRIRPAKQNEKKG